MLVFTFQNLKVRTDFDWWNRIDEISKPEGCMVRLARLVFDLEETQRDITFK